MAARQRPEKLEPTPPDEDVADKVDPKHTDEDFLSDLGKVATNDAKRRLADPSGPDRGSPRTSE